MGGVGGGEEMKLSKLKKNQIFKYADRTITYKTTMCKYLIVYKIWTKKGN